MDNLSHSLAGMLAAETLIAIRGPTRRAALPEHFGRVAWITSALANNLPDSDILYNLIDASNLGYLLHHRGHTHTLAIGWPLGWLVLLLPWLWARRGRHVLGREGWGQLVGLVALGPLIHIGLDSLNNYGVHPFWPVSNRWFYGDTIFIIEPFFWVSAIPLLLPSIRMRAARWCWTGVLMLGLGLLWFVPFVPWASALGLTLLTGGLFAFGRRREPLVRTSLAVALCLSGLGVFVQTRAAAEEAILAKASADFPEWTVHDLVLTPLPSTPVCWEAMLVTTREDRDYAVRRARVAPWPSLWPVHRCPAFAGREPGTAPWMELELETASADVEWEREHRSPLAPLRELPRQSCAAHAFLRFGRVPFVLEAGVPGSAGLPVIGDLRYDREEGLGFSEVIVRPGDEGCPRHVPPWEWPTGALLKPRPLPGGSEVRPVE